MALSDGARRRRCSNQSSEDHLLSSRGRTM